MTRYEQAKRLRGECAMIVLNAIKYMQENSIEELELYPLAELDAHYESSGLLDYSRIIKIADDDGYLCPCFPVSIDRIGTTTGLRLLYFEELAQSKKGLSPDADYDDYEECLMQVESDDTPDLSDLCVIADALAAKYSFLIPHAPHTLH